MDIDEILPSLEQTGSSGGETLQGREGTLLAGRYRLLHLLDHGGFGAVYEGKDERFLNKRVAVKLQLAAVSSENDFKREALLLGQLNHENVVRVNDHGVENGVPYIVMDMLHGDRLDVLAEKNGGRLSEELLVQLVREIGSALYNCHLKNLVHRDLKPKNIMLVDTGSIDELGKPLLRFVLFDFGLACKVDARNSVAYFRNDEMRGAGTAEYMSPEQVNSEETTPRADLYAFGVILYQMVTGRVPFPFPPGVSGIFAALQVMNAHVTVSPPRFSEVAPDVEFPAGLEQLVFDCLNKAPERRPPDVMTVRNRFLEIYGERIKTGPGKSSLWQLALKLLVIIVPLACLLLFAVLRPPPVPIPPAFDVQVPEQLTLVAGETRPLSFAVKKPDQETVSFNTKIIPSDVSMPARLSTKEDLLLWPVTVDLNASPGTKELVLRAVHGKIEKELRARIRVSAPKVWLPEKGRFPISHGGKIVAIDGQNLYEWLSYDVPGIEPVRFLLIDTMKVTRKQNPFYVMENKVWNNLYQKFAKETPNVSNRSGAASDNQNSGQLPAFSITLAEAMMFGQWLAGPSGQLPTTEQWWTAAGYFDREHPAEFPDGPFRSGESQKPGMSAVLEKARAVGTSDIDVNNYGVRDLATNGLEWTCSSYPIGARVSFPIKDENVSLYLVGKEFGYRRLTYQDGQPYFFASSDQFVASCPASLDQNDLGFRLIIEVSP